MQHSDLIFQQADTINYKELWLSVLQTAVADLVKIHATPLMTKAEYDRESKRNTAYIKNGKHVRSRASHLFKRSLREVTNWFCSKEQGPGSYYWICDIFDLNPKFLLEHPAFKPLLDPDEKTAHFYAHRVKGHGISFSLEGLEFTKREIIAGNFPQPERLRKA